MRSTICLRLLCLVSCWAVAWPLLASETPSVGQQREDVLFWSQAEHTARFPRMYEIFPADRVDHGAHVHALPHGAALTPQWQDGSSTLAGYMTTHHLAGVMVLQHGRIRLQRHAPGFDDSTRWTSFSVAKSVTSTLLGIALRRGDIHGMDDTLDTYIPQLRDSAYAKVTVEQLLTMTSGVRWNEDYADPHSDVAQMYRAACENGQAHVISYLAKLPRAYPAGTHWNYNTAETDLLGILVQRATKQSLAAYLSQAIWKPYGMASDAYWLKDECDGSDTGGSGLSATLADYARIGQFMLDGGKIGGQPVIAEAWMHGAMRKQQDVDSPGHGYGYLWWTDTDGSYAAIGIYGQMVYVDPARQLVIVQVGAWPQATSKELVAARRDFVDAVKRAVDGGPTR
ncbi:serine hydrolase [Rhodanobacter sp. Root561]|uniref:serine hydrolase domain-containing protein n=1 Tax=Rhodanobacter sp. Root561 TaxID=1736560 RepID=UPI0006F7B651|nr:serine hydrolase [Rhodanobacter sp. Root561]KQZ72314.1 serine hydrolase [Rhodanobacter sp. Root561]